jgi:hypothetical protein
MNKITANMKLSTAFVYEEISSKYVATKYIIVTIKKKIPTP